MKLTQQQRAGWLWRTSLASVLGVVSAALAHGMMGGSLPGISGFIAPLVLTTFFGLLVLRRDSLGGSLATAILGQWLFHQLASIGSTAPASGGHHHAGALELVIGQAGTGMFAGHMLAAGLTSFAVVSWHRLRASVSQLRVLLGSLAARIGAALGFLPRIPRSISTPELWSTLLISEQVGQLLLHGLRAPPARSSV